MNRQQQQIIDDAGERQMRDIFEPLGWAVRAVHKDNGIDFDIEIQAEYWAIVNTFLLRLARGELLVKYSTCLPPATRFFTATCMNMRFEGYLLTVFILSSKRGFAIVAMIVHRDHLVGGIQTNGRRKKTKDTSSI
jgi:hypothetical protein